MHLTIEKKTTPFEQHLLFELINSTISGVSRKEGAGYHAIDKLIGCYIESETHYSRIKALNVLSLMKLV
jgi:transposase